jgi:hypothetical protein
MVVAEEGGFEKIRPVLRFCTNVFQALLLDEIGTSFSHLNKMAFYIVLTAMLWKNKETNGFP